MAHSTNFSDRMSDADALLWNIESDPALRSTIVTVWVLDRAPDWERFHRKFERIAREIPRLRQRPVSDPLGLAPPRWENDPNFDLKFHLRHIQAPGDGALRTLLDIAEPIGMQAFDRDRPLWELTVVDGLADGRTGMIMKLHHAVSDGVGLVRMTEGMIERTREEDASERKPLPPLPEPATNGEWQRTVDAARHRAVKRWQRAARIGPAVASGWRQILTHPGRAMKTVKSQVESLGRLLAPVTEPLSPAMRGRSLSVHYDHLMIPFADLKRAAKAANGTLNDAFVAAVTGGLRRYHEALGAPVEELRMNMPINLRSGDNAKDAGNQFAPVRFAVPVAETDPAQRMQQIHELVAAQRAEPALRWMDPISGVIGGLPGGGAARFSGAMMKAIDFTTSNVPGPSFPVYVSGAKIESMFGFGPLAGAAANFTLFSYDGQLGVGINVDPAAVTDPALLVESLSKGFDEVLTVV